MEKIFLKLFEENKQKLIRICMFYEKNTSDRMDLYQEIAYQVWRSIKTFRNDSNINTWLYRIAINTAISFRRKKKNPALKLPLDYCNKIRSKDDPGKEFETKDLLFIIYDTIGDMNKIEQTVILLFLEGFSHAEIAEITGLKENNIAVKISRIKTRLKKTVEVQNGFK